jgi:hypothetical protein
LKIRYNLNSLLIHVVSSIKFTGSLQSETHHSYPVCQSEQAYSCTLISLDATQGRNGPPWDKCL